MKRLLLSVLFSATVAAATAQTVTETDRLKQELGDLRAQFEKTQKEQQAKIEALTQRIEALSGAQKQSAKPSDASLEKQLAEELAPPPGAAPPGVATIPATAPRPEAAAPMMKLGSAYMNISFDALLDAGYSTDPQPSQRLQLGDHDPIKRGFTLPNAEIALDGAVDPYFKGFANLLFKLDKNDDTEVELEEAYLIATDLPWNLQLKGGQFFANFGRQNSQHPHQWMFVDAPIILTRAFGPDGLRDPGLQLSWLLPTATYSELSLGVLDGDGGSAQGFRGAGFDDGSGTLRYHGRTMLGRPLSSASDLVFVPKISTSFDLTDQQTVVLGMSGAFGRNNSGIHSSTEIYGVDAYWKWKSRNAHGGFPFVSWQTEALYERYGAGADTLGATVLPAENLRDHGIYSQVVWGFRERWVTGLRGEYAGGNRGVDDAVDPFRGERYRISPMLTFLPSEFSKIRLQYNYDHGEYFGVQHSIWLQFEFLLGAHAAHKF